MKDCPLDLRYVYDFQKPTLKAHWQFDLPVRQVSEHRVKNAMVLPYKYDGQLFGTGGVTEADGTPVEASWQHSHKGFRSLSGNYEYNRALVETIDEECVYIGPYAAHYGHFLIDTCSRLYAALKYPHLKCVFITGILWKIKYVPQITRLLQIMGIASDRLIILTKPTRVRELIIPQEGYVRSTYYTHEYLSLFQYVAENIQPTIRYIPSRVFFSRLEFAKTTQDRTELGLDLLQRLFVDAGFTPFYPEKLSIDDQIALINGAQEFAATSGTLVHTLLFSNNRELKINIVHKNPYLVRAITDTLMMKNIAPVYMDFYIAKYPGSTYKGPSIIAMNDPMAVFIKDRAIDVSKSTYYGKDYTASCVKAYLEEYNNFWANSKELPLNSGVHLREDNFPPQLFTRWVRDYLRYEKIVMSRYFPRVMPQAAETPRTDLPGLAYDTHLSGIGWQPEVESPGTAGSIGTANYVEALRIRFKTPGYCIYYQVYYANSGWSFIKRNGEECGSTGKAKKIQGLRIWLGDLGEAFAVHYRAFGKDWTGWAKDGEDILLGEGIRGLEVRVAAKSALLPRPDPDSPAGSVSGESFSIAKEGNVADIKSATTSSEDIRDALTHLAACRKVKSLCEIVSSATAPFFPDIVVTIRHRATLDSTPNMRFCRQSETRSQGSALEYLAKLTAEIKSGNEERLDLLILNSSWDYVNLCKLFVASLGAAHKDTTWVIPLFRARGNGPAFEGIGNANTAFFEPLIRDNLASFQFLFLIHDFFAEFNSGIMVDTNRPFALIWRGASPAQRSPVCGGMTDIPGLDPATMIKNLQNLAILKTGELAKL